MYFHNDFFLMNSFPDFHKPCFDITEYNKVFEKKNVLIHAVSKDVSYAEHWGPLSIKCTIKGTEHYKCNNRFYSVDGDHYLIFNNGQYYSSYIYSEKETESFTINFSPAFQQSVIQNFSHDLDAINEVNGFEFIEKLYKHDKLVSPLIMKLYNASAVSKPDMHCIQETYYQLLESLVLQQRSIKKEIQKVGAVKYSTQAELYKRLNYAKDFIHSCYMNEISIDALASVACLNTAYFLREFKKYFGITPYQYIIMQRLKAARKLLETTSQSITEVCLSVGYNDITSFCKLFKKNFCITPEQYQLAKRSKVY